MKKTVKIDALLHDKVKARAALERVSIEEFVELATCLLLREPTKRKDAARRRNREKP